jgi:hypothetical protein
MPSTPSGFVQKYWKIVALACMCGVSYFAGVRQGSGLVTTKEVAIETKKETANTVATSSGTVNSNTKKTTKKTTIEKPDGTKVVVVTETSENNTSAETNSKTESSTSKESSKETRTETVQNSQPNYSISAYKTLPLTAKSAADLPFYTFGVGRRILGGFWAVAQYRQQDSSLGLGLRYDF